jgi:hypothetical protein
MFVHGIGCLSFGLLYQLLTSEANGKQPFLLKRLRFWIWAEQGLKIKLQTLF